MYHGRNSMTFAPNVGLYISLSAPILSFTAFSVFPFLDFGKVGNRLFSNLPRLCVLLIHAKPVHCRCENGDARQRMPMPMRGC
jgi:hypothetical protein